MTESDSSEPQRPWYRSGTGVAVIAAFAVPLLVVGLSGFLPTVPIVYSILFLEGDLLVYLVIRRGRLMRVPTSVGGDAEPNAGSKVFFRPDTVESMTSLVKWASKGSEYSRREIALKVVRMMKEEYPPEVEGRIMDQTDRLTNALRSIVYPFRNDQVLKAEAAGYEKRVFGADGGGGRASKVSRGRYLASLDEVLSVLEPEKGGGP